jgi:nitric oxide reductase NorQ protein
MTSKLSNPARTILRSRVRRHPKSATVVPDGTVSGLSNADLVQAAMLLELTVPGEFECAEYVEAKRHGETGPAAIRHADTLATTRGAGGAGLVHCVNPTDHRGNPLPEDAEYESVDYDEADADADAETEQVTTEQAPDAIDPDADAKAAVSQIQGLFGQGDFPGYQSALLDLARKATAPVQYLAAPTAYVDPAKVQGTIPTTTHSKTAAQLGLSKPNAAHVPFAVYDAQDAPPIDPHFSWHEETGGLISALAAGVNIFGTGPAGTGKTEFAKQIAAHFGRPFVRISFDKGTEAGVLVGMTVPDSASGGTRWQDGQLTRAIRRPGTIILLDELSAASAGALMVLQPLLDGERAIQIQESGERIAVAPGVVFFAADNTGGFGDVTGQYEGTGMLNRATLDRFGLFVGFDYLETEAEIRVLSAKTGISTKRARHLVKFANLTRVKATEGGLSHALGLRRLMALATALQIGFTPSAAFRLSVLAAVPHDDVEVLRQLWHADVDEKILA